VSYSQSPVWYASTYRLHAVAEIQLLKDVRDVRLDGGLSDVELVPDFGVREAASHQAKDVSFALTEFVEIPWEEPDETRGRTSGSRAR
jgi:hypothetical protein